MNRRAPGGGRDDSPQRRFGRLRVTTVEGADPHGEHQVVGWLAGVQFEILDGTAAVREGARLDLGRRDTDGLFEDGAGAVDGEHVTVADERRDGSGGGAGAAADLQHPKAGPERQRVDDSARRDSTSRLWSHFEVRGSPTTETPGCGIGGGRILYRWTHE